MGSSKECGTEVLTVNDECTRRTGAGGGSGFREKKEKKKANSTVHFYSEPRIENTVDQYHVFI